ncbi:MAG: hypothetical protein PWP28_1360 [Oceanotoga sp.]|uniref:WD40 repeat protein n=1 Tax=Oceanotoga teriensis TaxID=515440 RepID=A0AA45C7P7_9BACT|nr:MULTISPECIES: hypothetical protein [Oceanotoga]MDN5342485.1 hypothetical protein [Oceanotoga sp.]PWJ95617.1 hypothetical protein C7380_10431 [Oceanotoga teriensis]
MKKLFSIFLLILIGLIGFSQLEVRSINISTKGAERMPFMFEDELYFVDQNHDIRVSKYINGQFSMPRKIKGDINTEQNELYPNVLLLEGKKIMYFTRYTPVTDYDVYKAEYNENTEEWINVSKVEELSTSEQEWGISVSPDHKKAFVTTKGIYNNLSNVGGRDIWMFEFKNGKWINPINLKEINTSFDEWDVFYYLDKNELYFSSKRDDSFGGYDIYSYSLNTKKINHLDRNINSDKDERSFFRNKDLMIFTGKSRDDGQGGYDLFIHNINPEEIHIEKTEEKISSNINYEYFIFAGLSLYLILKNII